MNPSSFAVTNQKLQKLFDKTNRQKEEEQIQRALEHPIDISTYLKTNQMIPVLINQKPNIDNVILFISGAMSFTNVDTSFIPQFRLVPIVSISSGYDLVPYSQESEPINASALVDVSFSWEQGPAPNWYIFTFNIFAEAGTSHIGENKLIDFNFDLYLNSINHMRYLDIPITQQ